jgi:Arc/MetJ family transcription regulator
MHSEIKYGHKNKESFMRTTLDIDALLIEKVVRTTGAPSKKKAIEIAMKEFIRAKRREELCQLIGNYDEFGLTLKELERMRSGS